MVPATDAPYISGLFFQPIYSKHELSCFVPALSWAQMDCAEFLSENGEPSLLFSQFAGEIAGPVELKSDKASGLLCSVNLESHHPIVLHLNRQLDFFRV